MLRIQTIEGLRILSIEETCKRVDLHRSSLQRLEEKGQFPKRIATTRLRRGYRSDQIDEWIKSRPTDIKSYCNANK